MLVPSPPLPSRESSSKPEQLSLCILGSTGSIGQSALKVVRNAPERFKIFSLSVRTSIPLLAQQIREFLPKRVAVQSEAERKELMTLLGSSFVHIPEILVGDAALDELVRDPEVDRVVVGIVGSQALLPVLSALRHQKIVALANKECLVAGGALVAEVCREHGARIIPVDSEHSAIFQALQGAQREELAAITLTASGGPFLDLPWEDFEKVKPDQAVKHPRWNMGAKVSVDSATLMNKALEMIEAFWLFSLSPDQIRVVIHPESILHSFIHLRDGSVLAQAGHTDMVGPIAYALNYPEIRLLEVLPFLDLESIGDLHLRPVDHVKFRAISLARECLSRQDSSCAVLNKANEVLVEGFLSGYLSFNKIVSITEKIVDIYGSARVREYHELRALEKQVAEKARSFWGDR